MILFLLFCAVLHPAVGIVDVDGGEQPNWVRFLGALTVLQMLAVMINLIPMPPLDGFGIIEPFLDEETQRKLRRPMVSWAGIAVLFFVVFRVDAIMGFFFETMMRITRAMGMPWELLYGNYNLAMFGHE